MLLLAAQAGEASIRTARIHTKRFISVLLMKIMLATIIHLCRHFENEKIMNCGVASHCRFSRRSITSTVWVSSFKVSLYLQLAEAKVRPNGVLSPCEVK